MHPIRKRKAQSQICLALRWLGIVLKAESAIATLARASSQNIPVVQPGCCRKATTSEIGSGFIRRPPFNKSVRGRLAQTAPRCRCCRDHAERGGTAVCFPFFEIALDNRHLVRDMSKAED